MKKKLYILTAILATIFSVSFNAGAVLPISKVSMIMPDDMVYIDMATSAAKKSAAAGNIADGAVIVKNSSPVVTTGAGQGNTAVANAIAQAGTAVNGAVIYTVNQPQITDLVNLSKSGAKTIYFVNGSTDVVTAGIYPTGAYDETAIPAGLAITPMIQLEYPDAQKLLSK